MLPATYLFYTITTSIQTLFEVEYQYKCINVYCITNNHVQILNYFIPAFLFIYIWLFLSVYIPFPFCLYPFFFLFIIHALHIPHLSVYSHAPFCLYSFPFCLHKCYNLFLKGCRGERRYWRARGGM